MERQTYLLVKGPLLKQFSGALLEQIKKKLSFEEQNVTVRQVGKDKKRMMLKAGTVAYADGETSSFLNNIIESDAQKGELKKGFIDDQLENNEQQLQRSMSLKA